MNSTLDRIERVEHSGIFGRTRFRRTYFSTGSYAAGQFESLVISLCCRIGIALVGSFLSAASANANYPTAVLADNPVAYWRFEDGNLGSILNGSSATDSVGVGLGNHPGVYAVEGTFADGPQIVAGVPGIGGLAAHFVRGQSGGEFILFDTLADVGSNIDNNGLTFEFFVKNLQTTTDFCRLFGVWNERPGGAFRTQLSYSLHRPANRQELFLRDDANVLQEFEFDNSVIDSNDGEWHHVAWVIHPGVPSNGMTVYVDGESVPLLTVTNNAPTMFANFDKAFMIGGEHANNSNPTNFTINAMVDEFAVYSGALSQAQIRTHLAAMHVVPEPASLSLIGAAVIILVRAASRKSKSK